MFDTTNFMLSNVCVNQFNSSLTKIKLFILCVLVYQININKIFNPLFTIPFGHLLNAFLIPYFHYCLGYSTALTCRMGFSANSSSPARDLPTKIPSLDEIKVWLIYLIWHASIQACNTKTKLIPYTVNTILKVSILFDLNLLSICFLF